MAYVVICSGNEGSSEADPHRSVDNVGPTEIKRGVFTLQTLQSNFLPQLMIDTQESHVGNTLAQHATTLIDLHTT
jgi:hypothetical protein